MAAQGLPAWLSPNEVAAHTGMSRSFIYARIDRGEIPARKFGNRMRVSAADMEAWIAKAALKRRADDANEDDGPIRLVR
jgi:excisionase family DNA binding protein